MSTKVSTKNLINKFSIINAGKYFSYLEFIPARKYIIYFSGTTWTDSWKSNRMSEENIENITESNSNFAPTFLDHTLLPEINFNGHFFKKKNIFIPEKVINLYIF